jgi:hypothetical protein
MVVNHLASAFVFPGYCDGGASRRSKLALFCTTRSHRRQRLRACPPAGCSRPSGRNWLCFARLSPLAAVLPVLAQRLFRSVRGKLALFRRGLLHVRFAITRFPPSTCPFCCLGGIGFVLHNCPDRRHQQSYPSRPFLSVRKLALFVRHPQPPACKAPSHRASPGIGFVSHNQPSPQIAGMGMGSQTR